MSNTNDISYIINQLGEESADYYNAIAPPIIQTTNFSFKTVEEIRNTLLGERTGYVYSRGSNPTVDILRKKMAALDGAEDALIFNSGMSALTAAILANVKAGDHILCVRNCYGWAAHIFEHILGKFDISVSYAEGTDTAAFLAHVQPNTSLIFLESPNSWFLELQDLGAIATYARSKNILTLIDNTYCTPLCQQPITHGIDLVMQTATKYVGGHSDTLGGILTGSRKLIQKIYNSEYMALGGGIQAINAWLLLRGLRTLPVRIERISQSTKKVLKYLKNEEKIERIIFPHDSTHPQYQLAKKQMKSGFGLLSFYIKIDSAEQIEKFCNNMRHFRIAVSWGGYESLILPRCGLFEKSLFNSNDPTHKLIRLYIGLEDPKHLIKDLKNSFSYL